MDTVAALRSTILATIGSCSQLLVQADPDYDLALTKLMSIREDINEIGFISAMPEYAVVVHNLDLAIRILETENDYPGQPGVRLGRPKIDVSISNIEFLLSLKFSAVQIAKMYGLSRDTILRRLREHGLSVRATYSDITDDNLDTMILEILRRFPNTGYKRMKGFLLQRGHKLTDQRVRHAMRVNDPDGCAQRTLCNRAIVRRQYFVQYFNQLWHLDTNMKLIRWNIVIRSCIDGKSRVVTYLHASGDNTAESNLVAFMRAVSVYGIPFRTRSDKGGENVLIARFMIEQRGLNRGSHICGRSVHNQRIERYWRDVYYGYTSSIYNVFTLLEENGLLDIDNPKHIGLLHKVFLPRINIALEEFMNAWNSHPISTERNYTPIQLMVLHLPPAHTELHLTEEDHSLVEFMCNQYEDTVHLQNNSIDSIVDPIADMQVLSLVELERIASINVMRESNTLGYDIFAEALACLQDGQDFAS